MSDVMQIVKNKDPQEREFHQAVSEVIESVKPVLDQNPVYRQALLQAHVGFPLRSWMHSSIKVGSGKGAFAARS